MRCHECPDTERAARGCRKPITDPGLQAEAKRTERMCAVDLEVQPWYWRAVEDGAMLAAGHIGLDDLSLVEYLVAQEVRTERERIEVARMRTRKG